MAPLRSGKVASDNINAFNIAVTEFKLKQCEKSLAEIDKILGVLTKVSDLGGNNGFEKSQLLINCQYLVSTLDHKSSSLWSVISLLTNMCTSDTSTATILRDKVCLLPVLSRLLSSVPNTSQARILKLLQLVRLMVRGVKISRREAWLSSMLSLLVSHLSSPELSSPCLYILCCLCQDNYIVCKMTMSIMSPETLSSMFSNPSTSPCDQLTAEFLLHSLTSLQLSPLSQSQDKIQSYLPKLIDVFCSSYSSDDIPLMSLIVSFLESVSNDSQVHEHLSQQDCLPHLQQLIVIADFSEGFCVTSATYLFSFMTYLVTKYMCDHVAMFDLCLKTVLLRLDSKPITSLSSAMTLLTNIFNKMEFSSMSGAISRNIKFQVDQLLPSLLSMFVEISKSTSPSSASKLASKQIKTEKKEIDKEALNSCIDCLILLQTIAQIDIEGWRKSVGSGVKSTKITVAFKAVSDSVKDISEKAKLSVEMLMLSSILAEVDQGWRTVNGDLINDKERINLVLHAVRSPSTENQVLKKALALLNNLDLNLDYLEAETEEDNSERSKLIEGNDLSVEQMTNIENLIENVENAVTKLEIGDAVSDVLQLADVRRGYERRQISYLNEALGAADQRLANQNLALLEREEQIRKLERIVSGLLSRHSATTEELRDIRTQHTDLSREADMTRDRLARELEETRGHVETLTGEREALSEKVVKYKGQVVSLSEDLEQYRDNQEQLEKRLKQEIKMKEEVSVSLGKREEKLKKKEKQLDEEMSARERLEKETDDLKRQCSSLETLTKRQEQALSKKEKQLQDQTEEMKEMKKIQDAIFNLSSKTRNQSTGAC